MGKKMSVDDINKLSALCIQHGFVRKGNTFFRAVGDGVLQIIKFQYERCFEHYSLDFGLLSLYEVLSEEDFSARNHATNYSICIFANQRNAVLMKKVDGIFVIEIMSPQAQIKLLEKHGFSWLDSIDSQRALTLALCDLDVKMHGEIIWNRTRKIAPYLATGNYAYAEKVIYSILNQHLGPESWTSLPWTEEDYARYMDLYPKKDADLIQIHEWISNNDPQKIQEYLSLNYFRNLKLGKFLRLTLE